MPVTRGVAKTVRLYLPRLGTRLLRPAPKPPRTTAPTRSTPAQSVWNVNTSPQSTSTGGTGSGSLSWSTGDVVVVIGLSSDETLVLGVPTASGLTFASILTPSAVTSSCWGGAWAATAGSAGSGVISETATGTGTAWGIIAWVVSGSDGVGGGIAAASVNGLTQSVGRHDDHSIVLEAIGDWGAGAVTGLGWTPSGQTQELGTTFGTAYTVYAADWGDQGTIGTTSYGITGVTPSGQNYTRVAVEVLGTTPPPVSVPGLSRGRPVQAKSLPARGGRVAARAGVLTVGAPQAGPPVYPLGHPVQARRLAARGGQATGRDGVYAGVGPPVKPAEGPVQAKRLPTRGGSAQSRDGLFGGVGPALKALASAVTARLRVLPPRGRSTGRSGVYAGVGPPVKPAEGPVAARALPQRGGHVLSRAGTFTATVPQAGPPIYPLGHPVQARRLPARGGRVTRAAGTYAGIGPPVRPAEGPVRAQALPTRGGRVVARVGTLTAGAPPAGSPVYPLGHPVCARRPPARGGYVNRRSGPYAGTGPAAPQLRQPVAGGRQQPPPPVRGRTGSLRGPFQGTGPKVRPLSGPVRARLPGPVRTGRVDTTLLPAVAVPPPPFSIGVLTATGFAPGTSAADYAPTEAVSGYAPGSSATDKRTGGPS